MTIPEKDIEVEVRGPLSPGKLAEFKTFLDANAKKTDFKDRILIDYSAFLEGGIAHRTKDIRVRCTNGVPEIIVKLGDWGGTEQRKELSAKVTDTSFDTLTQIFAALGYTKGMLVGRKSQSYEYKGIEFTIVELSDPRYSIFEAEKMAHANEDQLLEEILTVCNELGLEVFSKQEFFNHIGTINKEVNEVFDAATASPTFFKERFGV
jgi:adenylate cyclase class IV